jgi:hypothetical protein
MSDKSFKFMTDFSIVSEYISESVTQKKQWVIEWVIGV